MAYITGADWRSFSDEALSVLRSAPAAPERVRIDGDGEVITASSRYLRTEYPCGCYTVAADHGPEAYQSWTWHTYVCDDCDYEEPAQGG